MSAILSFILEPVFLLSFGILLLLIGEWADAGFWTLLGVLGIGYFTYTSNTDPRILWLAIPYIAIGFFYSMFSYREFIREYSSIWTKEGLKPSNNKSKIVYWIFFWPVHGFVRLTSRFTDTVFGFFKGAFQKIYEAEIKETK